ncbi:hypothetical protein Sjap_000825 [Stephania japonica]|uniref:Uncharacterized protein n=1 Tax=Stephania japonica TaxID=461633 RepID=A0AAP0KLD6_9MAGN
MPVTDIRGCILRSDLELFLKVCSWVVVGCVLIVYRFWRSFSTVLEVFDIGPLNRGSQITHSSCNQMGITFTCPGCDYESLDEGFETVYVRSFSFNGDEVKTAVRSVSFNGRNAGPKILKSIGSGKMIFEGSVSLKGREMETMISIKAPLQDMEKNVPVKSVSFRSEVIENRSTQSNNSNEKIRQSPMLDMGAPKHEAALKLQKVYKSFRTRRQLADCAVLVEQRWWKLLDFAELKRSSVSFFNIEKPETAVSRWSRARKRAAKIDPRHRYGHNLHFYYDKWLHCDSRQPFFYWLDIGKGKEVNLVDKCPRSKLHQQCIKYLGPIERKAYEVAVENGKFFYRQSGKLLDTTEEQTDAKWIFVLSTSKTLYVGKKKKGTFQHSSFLAGGATSAAGRLVVEKGVLKAVWPHSGHYRPTEANFQEFVSFLKGHDVDLTNVQKSPMDDDEEFSSKRSMSLRSKSCQRDHAQVNELEAEVATSEDSNYNGNDLANKSSNVEPQVPRTKRYLRFGERLTSLEIPKRSGSLENLESEEPSIGFNFDFGSFSEDEDEDEHLDEDEDEDEESQDEDGESPLHGYETAEEFLEADENDIVHKRNLFEEDQEESDEEVVPRESIFRRISSKKGLKSYQLGKQLSCTWTTGAGPRISCVRDYPSALQFRALEEVNLSPRSIVNSRAHSSPRYPSSILTPTNLSRETSAQSGTNYR